MRFHLLKRGFVPNYTIWHEHGEDKNLDSVEEDGYEGEDIDTSIMLDNMRSGYVIL